MLSEMDIDFIINVRLIKALKIINKTRGISMKFLKLLILLSSYLVPSIKGMPNEIQFHSTCSFYNEKLCLSKIK